MSKFFVSRIRVTVDFSLLGRLIIWIAYWLSLGSNIGDGDIKMRQRGQISRFDLNSDDWVIYCEQLEQHFLAYDVAEDKQVSMLLSSLPADVYTALRAILSPDIPSSKTYAEIKNDIDGIFETETVSFHTKI